MRAGSVAHLELKASLSAWFCEKLFFNRELTIKKLNNIFCFQEKLSTKKKLMRDFFISCGKEFGDWAVNGVDPLLKLKQKK